MMQNDNNNDGIDSYLNPESANLCNQFVQRLW